MFLFVALGLNSIGANYLSTGIAFIFSFFANKSFTFRSKGGNVRKQFLLFIVVTIFGLWVIQPVVILGVTAALASFSLNESAVLFVAKLIATLASLVWNYLFYSKLVFKKQ